MDDPMSDEEMIERMRDCACKERFIPAVGIGDVLELAGWEHSDWHNFKAKRIRVGSVRKQRLAKAIAMVQTGCVHKINGILHIGPPTRPLPPRVNLVLSSAGPKLEPAAKPQRTVGGLPSFKDLFSRG